MITWYEDDEIGIYFDKIPDLRMQYVMPWMTDEQKEEINKKPFINLEKLKVKIVDGATIPRAFWRLIGSKTDNKFLIPSLIHDVLCENHDYIEGNRYLSTIVFERLLYVSEVNAFNRWMIKHSVDNFQKLFGNW